MIVSASQPFFVPYPGFFRRLCLADVFVILDGVQFPRGGTWITRNRFKNDQGVFWIRVPVLRKSKGLMPINEARISSEEHWIEKTMESMRHAYMHAPYYSEYIGMFAESICSCSGNMSELDTDLIFRLASCLGISTPILLQSEIGIRGAATELIVNLCGRLEANSFLAPAPALKYIDCRYLFESGIGLETFAPDKTIYPQLWGNFIANLSVLDLLFNCGPRAADIVQSNRKETRQVIQPLSQS